VCRKRENHRPVHPGQAGLKRASPVCGARVARVHPHIARCNVQARQGGIYAISVILDPRFKVDYYDQHNWEPEMIAHAKDALRRAMESYKPSEWPSSPADRVVSPEAGGSMRAHLRKRRCVRSELEKYLAESVVDDLDEDILEWWKCHARTYPCLARIARDYLAIPATSAPAERAFSVGKDLVPDNRGSLSEKTIQACMCLSGWL
jgi:hypothetical protein